MLCRRGIASKALSGIRYADDNRIAIAARAERHCSAAGSGFDTMLDCVFDQGDQQIRWKRVRFELRRDVDHKAHPSADTHLQNVEIGLSQFGLPAERRRAGAQLRERRAQIVDQMSEERACFLGIRLRQILHRRQRVEQKVRLDLSLHQLELGLDRLF